MKDKLSPFSERNVHEENIPRTFWEAVERLKEGKGYDGDISAFPHLGAKYVRGEGVPLINITPTQLAELLLELFWGREELKVFLKEAGPVPPLLVALAHVVERRKAVPFLKEMLSDENLRPLALELLSHLPREMREELLEEVVAIARKEVGLVQHKALQLLADFVEREEVKDLFLSFLDDWDKEVRKISAVALYKVRDKKVAERAREALELEKDPYVAFLMKRLLQESDGEPGYSEGAP